VLTISHSEPGIDQFGVPTVVAHSLAMLWGVDIDEQAGAFDPYQFRFVLSVVCVVLCVVADSYDHRSPLNDLVLEGKLMLDNHPDDETLPPWPVLKEGLSFVILIVVCVLIVVVERCVSIVWRDGIGCQSQTMLQRINGERYVVIVDR
jgi:hypothetical protein